jgi:hypothetical protein
MPPIYVAVASVRVLEFLPVRRVERMVQKTPNIAKLSEPGVILKVLRMAVRLFSRSS